MEPIEVIQTHSGSRRCVRIGRRRPANPTLTGYVVGCSEDLCMIHTFRDFAPDGYAVMRIDDISSARSSQIERHWDKMLEGEQLLGGLDHTPDIDLSSMRAAIASAHGLFGRVVFECEDAEEPIEDFYIGRVASTGESAVRLHHFDALGHWTKTPDEIAYDEVTLLEIETPYIQRFWRYVADSAPA